MTPRRSRETQRRDRRAGLPDRRARPTTQVRGIVRMMGEGFRDTAPMTADQAATVILDGVRAGEWRILVGDDAQRLDERVRADPLVGLRARRHRAHVAGRHRQLKP